MPRQPSCTCGECPKCNARIRARQRYQSLAPAERRALVARRSSKRVRAADRARYRRDRDKRLAAQAKYQATPEGHDAAIRAKAAWAKRNPEKRKAQIAVGNALRDGRLERGPCAMPGPDCGGRIEAHHEDYSRPLDVVWLCAAHHRATHAEVA